SEPAPGVVSLVDLVADEDERRAVLERVEDEVAATILNGLHLARDDARDLRDELVGIADELGSDLLALVALEADLAILPNLPDDEANAAQRRRLQELRTRARGALQARVKSIRDAGRFYRHLAAKRGLVAVADVGLNLARA